ncbi:MAG: mechanosensitive ion channel family protein [Deltaproteobacteria bacterium]|nr:mechanosensitive ion channel family protein [Deltaproteobacteria bacterium]
MEKLLNQGSVHAFAHKALEWAAGALPLMIFTLLAAILAMALFKTAVRRLERFLARRALELGPELEMEKRVATMTGIVRRVGLVALWAITIMILLRELGVDIAPILAGAGIVGLAVGFGAQNLVKDVLSGFFMLLEDQVRVGDTAVVNGTEGLVEAMSLRTIRLRDLTGTVHVFPHGAVQSLANRTKGWSAAVLDVAVAFKEDTDRVAAVMIDAAAKLRKDPAFAPRITDDLEVFGVADIGESAVVIKIRMKTVPGDQWDVGRELRRRIKKAFDAQGIEIPFPHHTVDIVRERSRG